MNYLLVAHPEIRKEIWYKQENVTNISLPNFIFKAVPNISKDFLE